MRSRNITGKAAIAASQNIKERDYWLKKLSGIGGKTGFLPTRKKDKKRADKFQAEQVKFEITGKRFLRLMQLSNGSDARLHMILATGLIVLLRKYTGNKDIIIGMPIYKQEFAGEFINTVLALRNQPAEHTFKELLLQVRQTISEAAANQNYPIDILTEKLNMTFDPHDFPLFDVVLLLENIHDKEYLRPIRPAVVFSFTRKDEYLEAVVEYNSLLYDNGSIERIAGHFTNLIGEVIFRIDSLVKDINILSGDEKSRLLFDFNGTKKQYTGNLHIHELFEKQVEAVPHYTALLGQMSSPMESTGGILSTDSRMHMTYRELSRKSDQVAGQLRQKGVLADTVVGIMVERSIEMIAGIIGILKAGAAYLPIDPYYPEERISYMLKDSDAGFLLTTAKTGVRVKAWERVANHTSSIIATSSALTLTSTSSISTTSSASSPSTKLANVTTGLAYVIYTSGSTGKPKGVMMGHQNLVNLIRYQYDFTDIDFSRVLQFATICFDVSFQEIFSTLLNGGELFLVDQDTRQDIPRLFRVINENDIKTLFLPASFLKFLFNEIDYEDLFPGRVTHIVSAGEQLIVSSRLRKYLLDHKIKLHNHYGPSETHVVTALTLDPTGEIPELPSIGKPILNTDIYILDRQKKLQPINVAGDLYIGGLQVGRGYMNNPQLTAEKFITRVTGAGARIYRTGDLARWLPDGNIEFLGRDDHQVKIRGFRVEPGEIESRLLNYNDIKGSAVIIREDQEGEKYLCSYIVAENKVKLDVSGIRKYLSGDLPGYMVPSFFVQLEKLPLTPNGKIDIKALPEPQPAAGAEDYFPPRNRVEKELVEIWSEILELEKESIGIDSDFFQVGGHSLNAGRMIARVHQRLQVNVPMTKIFIMPTIRKLAEYINGSRKEIQDSIEPVETREYYELSSAQQRLFILQQMDPTGTGYNMPLIMKVEGQPDRDKWENAFRDLIKRHESLRTSFRLLENEPVQKIHPYHEVEFELEYDIEDFVRPFDLTLAPLLRVGFIKTGEQEHMFRLDMHHIISDGISTEVLINDFTALYRGEELPMLKVQYKEYVRWQNQQKQSQTIKEQEKYWLKEFSNQEEIPVLNLPTDFTRPVIQSSEGSVSTFEIGNLETGKLKSLAYKESSTLYLVLLTLFNVFLAKISRQEEIIVGVPAAGRKHADLEQIIGMFVNTLALRNYPAGEKTFLEFLYEVTTRTLEAQENQDYPFENLVEQVVVNRDHGRNPLFDVMLTIQDIKAEKISVAGLTLSPSEDENIKPTSKFHLTLTVLEAGEGLRLHFTYGTQLFKKETIERFIGYFKRIVSPVIRQPGIRIADIEILSEEEKHRLLVDFNKTATGYPGHRCLHELFVRQAESAPDHTALVGQNIEIKDYKKSYTPGAKFNTGSQVHLSYKELNTRSNHLAHILRGKGIRPDTIVGIMVERSIVMIIGILGILKAGGAYSPIDPGNPRQRVGYMLSDSRASALVTTGSLMEERNKTREKDRESEEWQDIIIYLEELFVLPGPPASPPVKNYLTCPSPTLNPVNSLACVIYTSGTTGKPKGVMIEHQNVVNVISWFARRYELQERTPVILLSNYTFDASMNQIFGALLHGAMLYLPHREMLSNPEGMRRYIEANHIFLINFVPTMINELLGTGPKIACIKHVSSGGEKLDNTLKNKIIKKGYILHNQYGPTEITIDALAFQCPPGNVLLGKPISNTRCYIFDNNSRPVPIGVIGEIWVAGHGVTRGYLNNPELTAGKFIVNKKLSKKVPGKKIEKIEIIEKIIYKTGDLARWLADGNIEFLGRIDHQVKIRGFRIELGEIESRLLMHNEIKETIVTIAGNEKKDQYLCAYVVSDYKIPVSTLREFLRKYLPEYMIPSYFVRLDRLPLTPNSKINRKALPEPAIAISALDYIPPGNEFEETLATIWSEVLEIEKEKIGINDDFFQLGGHSLKATRMVAKLQQILHVNVPLAEVFKTPFIRELAQYIKQYIKEAGKVRYSAVEPGEKKEYYTLSSAQQRLYILQQLELNGIAYNMPHIIPLPTESDTERLENTCKRLIRRHESLRTSFSLVNEEPVQRIHEHVKFKVEYDDLTSTTGNKTQLSSTIIHHFIRPFDLSRAPLLRAGLVKTGEKKFILLLDMHHIITDGTSQAVLAGEFTTLYMNPEENPTPLRLQYKDYAQWQNTAMQKERIKQQKNYWIRMFSTPGELPVLNLPTDFPRPVIQSFEGNRADFVLDREETQRLKELAKKTDATLFMILLSAYAILLAKLSGQEDIVVGIPIAARRHADLEGIVGMFVNTLAIRDSLDRGKTVKSLLIEIKKRTIAAFENQEYPFEDLVDNAAVRRDTSRNPLFDVMFNLLNQTEYQDLFPGVNNPDDYSHEIRMIRRTSKFDLNLTAVETADGEGLFFDLEYSTKLFKSSTIKRFIGYFKQILSIISSLSLDNDAGETLKLSDLEMTPPEEKEKILTMSGGSEEKIDFHQTIQRWFEKQAATTPDTIALVGIQPGEQQRNVHCAISYRELDKKSNQLARLLRKKGVCPDQVVGLAVDPSMEIVIGMLAILKAGGAYLPLDAKLPGNRKRIICKESTMRILLTDQPPGNITYLDEETVDIIDISDKRQYRIDDSPLEHISKADHLAYVIYTSGSTGIPKGVMLEHRSLVNLLVFHHKNTNIDCSRVSQFASIGFDASFHEIFSTLLAGGTLYIPGKEVKTDIPGFCRMIRENDIKTTFLPIAFLKMIFSEESYAALFPGNLQHIQTAGEQVVIIDKFRQYLKKNNVYLHNHYGPSETHVVTALTLEPHGEIPERPSIGKPICNTGIYIIDKSMLLQPIGVAGELVAGGIAVGRGYQNNPEKTSEKFCLWQPGAHVTYSFLSTPAPCKNLSLLYRTGDLARWLGDGNIEFLGRIDFQLKIRGFRIELGEIETQLLKHDGIKEAVVIPRQDKNSDKYLCAYIVAAATADVNGAASGKSPDSKKISEFLSQSLPDYMIPSRFMHIDKIPVNPNGKIDRNALPAPGINIGENYAAPRNEIEKKLVKIWQEVLGPGHSIGIADNFFLLGGHSLKATILISKIHRDLNVKVPLAEVFKNPTIRGIYRVIQGLSRENYISVQPVEKKEYYALSSAQRRLYFLQQLDPGSTGYNITAVMLLEGALKTGKLNGVIKILLARHDSLRTSFIIVDGTPRQYIRDKAEFELEYYDKKQVEKEKINHYSFIRPFDLAHAPLLRVGLMKIREAKHLFIVDMHHIISDGFSHNILVQDFMTLYRDSQLQELPLQYKDFSEWQNKIIESGSLKEQEEYWLARFAGELPEQKLPFDFDRPSLPGFAGNVVDFEIGKNQATGLKKIALAEEATQYMVLLAIFNVLLSKLCGSEDIIIGTPAAGRKNPELEQVIGMFVNTLVLRNYPVEGKSFREFLRQVKTGTLNAFENQDYPFERLVERVGKNEKRDVNRNPLFDVMFALQNMEITELDIPGLKLSPYEYESKKARFDLSLTGIEETDRLVFSLEYNTTLFKKETPRRLITYFKTIVSTVVENTGILLSGIELIGEAEKNRLLHRFNNSRTEYPGDKTIHQLIEARAIQTPDQIALKGSRETSGYHVSYKEMNLRAGYLGHLLKEKGITPDMIVGIMVEPCVEMIMGILGVWKAGGAYLPIDSDNPPDRTCYMLADSGANVLVTTSMLLKKNKTLRGWQGQTLFLDDISLSLLPSLSPAAKTNRTHHTYPSCQQASGTSLAYVIYTSGSTGLPKGVLVEHGNLVEYIFTFIKLSEIDEKDVVLQQTSISFDASMEEIYPTLSTGAKLIVINKETGKDTRLLAGRIQQEKITLVSVSPLLLNEINKISKEKLQSLRLVIAGGDVLKPGFINNIVKDRLIYNSYGPTEATVCATFYKCPPHRLDSIPIGKPIGNMSVYIMDRVEHLQPIGIAGELWLGGDGIARGYLNRPELTDKKFLQGFPGLLGTILKKCPGCKGRKIYRTGDLAKWLPDGNIEFLGRIDQQVKIRGYRIELGEIENRLMNHEDIKEAVVTAKEDFNEEVILCAYVVSEKKLTVLQLRNYLSQGIPAYMVPARFVQIAKIPLTSGGKVDRKALPALGKFMETGKEYTSPKSNLEKKLTEIWLEVSTGDANNDTISINDNFFDLGGNSFTLVRFKNRINDVLNIDIPLVNLFNYPTTASLAGYLGRGENALSGKDNTAEKEISENRKNQGQVKETEIAVVGMAGRFPGAKNTREFWDNLKNGVESISFLTEDQLNKLEVETETRNHPDYVSAKGRLQDIECFDSFFFSYTPAEAGIMDPQIRFFHECTWEALENAGYDPGTYEGTIGLYAGASANPYWDILPLRSSGGNAGKNQGAEQWDAVQFCDKDFLSTRVGYKLDLKGPCVTVQTACSTSLAAVEMACQALLTGKCDMALAGGVSITFLDEAGYIYQEGTIASPDGHCRAFAAGANGTVGGNGAGAVVLKPLQKAVKDRDSIYAVIKGSAINNDGKDKVGFTAPGVEGQARAIGDALTMAGLEPECIGYVETHGTGTQLGDPVEIQGLKQAFKTENSNQRNYCAIGTVKTNIGHLDAAAGIAGFIKTVLGLTHRLIPPSLHFERWNPVIDPAGTPFYVNTTLAPWKNSKYPLGAGVSSFGLGGTNVHIILEEAPDRAKGIATGPNILPPREFELMIFSAKIPSTLDKMAKNLAGYFKDNLLNPVNPVNPGQTLADAAYTLKVGRKAFLHRKMLVCPANNVEETIRALEAGEGEIDLANEEKSTVIFMFSGQGSQFVKMGADLYQTESIFREQVDHCFEILENIAGIDMKPVLYPDLSAHAPVSPEHLSQANEKIHQFLYTTPIKFIFEYSLAVLLMKWGIEPGAMIGHSFGEYAAACLSGVFSLEDALFLAALRGRLMHGLPPGAMLSVSLPEEELKPWLNDNISLAAVNGESLCVVSGPVEAVDALEKLLNEKGHQCLRYLVPRAGHSWMVEPILEEFKEKISRVTFNKPRIPYISGLTGKWITAREAMDPDYWARHLREPVRFADGLTTLYQLPNPVFLQVGPGRGLTLFVNQHPDKKTGTPALNMVRHRKEEVSDVYYTLTKIGQLWLKGIPIDWQAFYQGQQRSRIPLPTYPFEKTVYPLSRDFFRFTGASDTALPGSADLRKKPDMADWFYIPMWERRPLPPGTLEKEEPQTYLLFIDKNRGSDLGIRLMKELEQRKHKVIAVLKGTRFEKKSDSFFCINPGKPHDYSVLLEQIQSRLKDRFPRKMIHLWGISEEGGSVEVKRGGADEDYRLHRLDRQLTMGFYSLIYLAKALGNLDIADTIQIDAVTAGVHEVTGQERLHPARAAVLGPLKVIPQELPQTRCRNIDILWPETGQFKKVIMEQLLLEIITPTADTIVALRNAYRWIQTVAPLRMPKPGEKDLPLKSGGVYLVTGGLGGIGLILAQHLAKSIQAKLILTGRSPFPPQSRWPQWLGSHPADHGTSRKIQKLKQMKEMGADVLVLQADVSNREQMENVIRRAEEKFGNLNGVIHCAGDVGQHMYNSIREISDLQCRAQFQPKVYGLLVLEKVLENRQLDFCLLMSSTSAILGGLGFAAYSAANIFMDAFVHFYIQGRTCTTRWLSVNWDGWPGSRENPGEPGSRDMTGGIGNTITGLAMTAGEGARAFERALAWPGLPQVIQSAGDLQTRINQWIKLEALSSREVTGKEKLPAHKARPPLSTPYTAPETPEEEAMVSIWGDILGYGKIGTRDNFFELGGDSLKAVIVTSKIHKVMNTKIPLKDFFNQPSIKGLARYITGNRESSYSSIEPREKKEFYPLSSAQKRMFIANQLEREKQSTAYHINSVKVLEGDLDRQRLIQTFERLVSRHESFRTAFDLIDGEPVQRIHHKVEFEIQFPDMTSVGSGEKSNLPVNTGKQEPGDHDSSFVVSPDQFIRPFDLSRAPLLRATLIKLAGKTNLLIVDMHHIISDGTSLGILVKEFITLYRGQSLSPLRIQYKDFQAWQCSEKNREVLRSQEKYWLEQFEPGCPIINIPLDFERPTGQDFQGSTITFRVDRTELDRLNALASREGATLFMVLLAIYTILISKITTGEDIVVGTGVAGRSHSDLENIMGMFINMLPMRSRPNPEKTFKQFLGEVKKSTLQAFENQAYPFEELVNKINTGKRQANRNPIFDVVFELQNMEIPSVRLPGLEIKSCPLEAQLSHFDMSWVGEVVESELRIIVEYRTDLFKKETIEGFIGYFKEILSTVAANKEIPIKDIRITHGLLSPKRKKPEIRLRF